MSERSPIDPTEPERSDPEPEQAEESPRHQPDVFDELRSEQATLLRPQILAVSIWDRERGVPHGVWLDAAADYKELQHEIRDMLRRSPTAQRTGQPSKWFSIDDFAGFGSFNLRKVHSFNFIWHTARGIVEHGPAFAAWAQIVKGSQKLLSEFESNYLGEWDSLDEYVDARNAMAPPPEPPAENRHQLPPENDDDTEKIAVVPNRDNRLWLFRMPPPDPERPTPEAPAPDGGE